MINIKPVIKNILKGLLSKLKKFKVQTVLVLDYEKRNDSQIFHSSTRLIASGLDIDEAFKSMHQSIITKIKTQKSTMFLSMISIHHGRKHFCCCLQAFSTKKT